MNQLEDVEDDVEEAPAVDVVEESDVDGPAPTGLQDRARKAFQRWLSWPLWAQLASGAAAIYVLVVVVGMAGAFDEDVAPAAPASTAGTPLDEFDPFANLPALAPIVQAQVRADDRAAFANLTLTVTADGTSVCDVFYGTKYVEGRDDKPGRFVWSLTTPNIQTRAQGGEGGSGVLLPSSVWPVRAFYGEPCNVADDDVPLPPLATTTTVATTEPTSPVTAG